MESQPQNVELKIIEKYFDFKLKMINCLIDKRKIKQKTGFILATNLCKRKNLTCSNLMKYFQT